MGGEIARNQTESSRSSFRLDDRGYPRQFIFGGGTWGQWEVPASLSAGFYSDFVASIPSTPEPGIPVPAMVLIIPVSELIFLIDGLNL